MTTLNQYFGHILCINLARRPDRWRHVLDQADMFNLQIRRLEGFDIYKDGGHWGNDGCTAAHRMALDLIVANQWPRCLILEDDFESRFPDLQERFDSMIHQVPTDWWMLYLGGHYAEQPIARVSKHVIRCGHMKTTSSYGVTLEAAREMAPYIYGIGPIDELYARWNQSKPCYIFQPRLMVQYTNYSDIQRRECNNEMCMTDVRHEEMV